MRYVTPTILIFLFSLFFSVFKMAKETTSKSDDLVERLISGLTNVLKVQGGSVTHLRAPKLSRFTGKYSSGELLLSQWLEEVDIYCDQCDIPSSQKAKVILNHLDGDARQEVKCHSISSDDLDSLINLLKRHFGSKETTQSLQKKFHERVQHEGESLDEFSRALMCMYDNVITVASKNEKKAYQELRDSSLIDKFVEGARSQSIRLELRRIQLANPGKTFLDIRDHALDLLDSFDTTCSSKSTTKHGAVYGVSVDDCPEGANSMPRHSDRDLITHLVQQQAALEQCVRQQQTMLERQQEQLSELIAQKSQDVHQYQRRISTCYHCHKPGHIRANCWKLQREMQNSYEFQTSGDLNANPPL